MQTRSTTRSAPGLATPFSKKYYFFFLVSGCRFHVHLLCNSDPILNSREYVSRRKIPKSVVGAQCDAGLYLYTRTCCSTMRMVGCPECQETRSVSYWRGKMWHKVKYYPLFVGYFRQRGVCFTRKYARRIGLCGDRRTMDRLIPATIAKLVAGYPGAIHNHYLTDE